MSRFVDRGAIVAAFVGVGMAVTMATGFLLIIPIEPAYILLSVPGGMVIELLRERPRRVRGHGGGSCRTRSSPVPSPA